MAKTLAKIFGVALLLLGIIGFFSNAFIGPAGYFLSNTGLNIVNAVLGIVLIAVSTTEAQAALWLKVMGIIYFLLAIVGFALLSDYASANVLGFMQFNMSDNWLYLISGIVMFLSSYTEETRVQTLSHRSHSAQM